MKHLYLIRGLPGAGKSTLAKTLAWGLATPGMEAIRLEADMYFEKDGEYTFDASKLHSAHLWCQRTAEEVMAADYGVIVSNTFTTEKELKPYLDLAEQYGYTVTTLIVENRHGNKSIHDVPEETMTKMRNRFSVKL